MNVDKITEAKMTTDKLNVDKFAIVGMNVHKITDLTQIIVDKMTLDEVNVDKTAQTK